MRRAAGFTLLEIMVALAILSFGLLTLIGAQGNSLRASGRAENIQTATLLGRQVMNEKLLEFQRELLKGTFPDEKEETGTFDPPLDRFRWEYKVRKVEIPVVGEGGEAAAPGAGEGGGTPGTGPGTAQAPEAAKRSLAQMVTKKISESVREISTKVIWDELGEEQSLIVTTHVSRVP